MGAVLLVEGPEDIRFFSKLQQLVGTEHLILPYQEQGLQTVIGPLIRADTASLLVAHDLNTHTPDQTIAALEKHLTDIGYPVTRKGHDLFEIKNSRTKVIPVGLYEDPLLSAMGVVRHSKDDYVVVLLLGDPSLTAGVKDFPGLLNTVAALMRDAGIRLDSSKSLYLVARAILNLQTEFALHTESHALNWLFRHVSNERLTAVTSDLLQALKA